MSTGFIRRHLFTNDSAPQRLQRLSVKPNYPSCNCVWSVITAASLFRQKDFFAGAAKMSAQQREEEYNKIKKDYTKVIDEANEKIHIAD